MIYALRNVVIVVCLLGTTLAGFAQDRRGRDDGRRPADGQIRDDGRFTYVAHYFDGVRYTGEQTIPVRKLLRLDESYMGYSVDQIMLVAKTDAGYGTASLEVDGREYDTVRVNDQRDTIIFDMPRNSVVGPRLGTIQIKLRGNFTLYRLAAKMEKSFDHGGDLEILSENYGQQFRTGEEIGLRKDFNIGPEYRGDVLKKVVVFASRDGRAGRVGLLINGVEVETTDRLSTEIERITFTIPARRGELGDDIRSLRLTFNGLVYVQKVQLHIETKNHNGGGRRR